MSAKAPAENQHGDGPIAGQYPESWQAFTLDQKAVLLVSERFKFERPDDLSSQPFADENLRTAVARLFDRLEGKLDPEKIKKLSEAFGRGIDIWAQAGLFTPEREAAGYTKPVFERDYQPLLTQEILDMTEAGADLNKGYSTPVFAPKDVPMHCEDADKLSYFKLLKDALLKAFHGTAGGKQPNTLLIGPEKRVLTADQVDLNAILYRWERYLQAGVVHNVLKLDPKKHGGVSENEVLTRLTGNEKRTGGVMRLERDQLIMPTDVRKEAMSALDWEAKLPEILPTGADAQDIKQAVSHIVYCLGTQGWMPDYYDYRSPETSRVNLALRSLVPDEGQKGAVPALYWFVDDRLYFVVGNFVGVRDDSSGVRAGVRIIGN